VDDVAPSIRWAAASRRGAQVSALGETARDDRHESRKAQVLSLPVQDGSPLADDAVDPESVDPEAS
jgi:hypothetical protein